MVFPWSVMNKTVARTPNSLLSHQGLSLSLRGPGRSDPGSGSCERVGCMFTLGLEAPCQEIRINAVDDCWLLPVLYSERDMMPETRVALV